LFTRCSSDDDTSANAATRRTAKTPHANDNAPDIAFKSPSARQGKAISKAAAHRARAFLRQLHCKWPFESNVTL
jgi:hypothetical protein